VPPGRTLKTGIKAEKIDDVVEARQEEFFRRMDLLKVGDNFFLLFSTSFSSRISL